MDLTHPYEHAHQLNPLDSHTASISQGTTRLRGGP